MRTPTTPFLIFALFYLSFVGLASAQEPTLAQKFSGRILLEVESYGRSWYVYPKTGERYYLKNGNEAFFIMRGLGLGITNSDLAKIPEKEGDVAKDPGLNERLKGYILLQVERNGEAWYVNPVDGMRYYLKNGSSAYQLMRAFGVGITDANLRKIPMNSEQITFDAAFNGVAYAAYNGAEFLKGDNSETILPLASLTKLMTALVFIETNPDLDAEVAITQQHIDYPKNYVGDDPTSEIPLQVGDRVSARDLLSAFLIASSNQSAAALVDASDMSMPEFVFQMNQKARALGLTKTVFFDPSGLDAHNVSTSKEMAIIANEAFHTQELAARCGAAEAAISVYGEKGDRVIQIKNRNHSLLRFNPEASKTGFLVEAQRTAVLKKDGKIIVVLHARSMNERNGIIGRMIKP
jgi:D-alanyl-D-alanine endopeptidase (penicillin-binding protein 7)